MSLQHLPREALPREKLLARGPEALSDAELLALLLRTGTPGRNVLLMAQDVLDACSGIAGLLHAQAHTLKRIKGLGGAAKRAQLLAVMELARRALAQQLQARPVLEHPRAVREYLQLHLAQLPREHICALFLDNAHRLIALETLASGTLNRAHLYPREVALRALHHHAASLLLAHNHPTGNVQPSSSDVALTRSLQQALALLDIAVLDHFIIGQGGQIVSMAESGLMAPAPGAAA